MAGVIETWNARMPGGVRIHYACNGMLRKRADAIPHGTDVILNLTYMDDVAILADEHDAFQQAMQGFADVVKVWGGVVNPDKTVWLVAGDPLPAPMDVQVDDKAIRHVVTATYLGCEINVARLGSIQDRLLAASRTFGALRSHVWNCRLLTLQTKVQVYKTCILPVLLYGLETLGVYGRRTRKSNWSGST